jgi:hypothetical protein
MTESALASLAILRKPQLTMHWYVIPLLVIVEYIYFHELREKHINVVLGGIALWGMDWFNEIWNSIVLHATNYAPVWGAPRGDTALQILVGYNRVVRKLQFLNNNRLKTAKCGAFCLDL